jgi:WD40 repeat protein/serine/threonine protein kinase
VSSAKAVTLEAFQELLRTGNLLSMDELERVVAEITSVEFDTARDFALWLVERNWVTRWQAQMMLAGSNRFFLGKYKLLERIGSGGMGTVFKAQQTGLGRFVALKVMSDALMGDEQSVARFHREIRSAAALEHPHIVATFDADCVGGKHFLVMEYVDGQNLQALAKQRGRLPMEEACEYIRQAALGLAHAHERGMIHRDIKPANLLVAYSTTGQPGAGNVALSEGSPAQAVVKILDFGLARLANESHGDTALTQTGQIMGTADYIAPEQARDTKAADIRSDLYSLGCTLFRLLAGEVPFKGQSVMEKLMARALEEAPRIRTRCPDLPVALEECVARMMARDPASRFQTPSEVVAAMAHFAAAPGIALPVPRSPIGWGTPVPGMGLDRIDMAGDLDPGLEQFLAVLATDADGDSGRAELADDTSPTGQGSGSGSTRPDASWRRLLQLPRAGRRTSSSQKLLPPRRRRLYMTAAIPAILFLVVSAALLWYRNSTTWIELDWPEEERKGATLEIDGREPVRVGRLSFPGRPGTRTLHLRRKGYEPIDVEWQLARGETIHYRPEWKLTPLAARRREAAALKAEIERLSSPSGGSFSQKQSAETEALREKCSDFVRRWLNTPEAAQITTGLRRLPAPVDGLDRERIPEYELRVSGGGDANAAPTGLVAVIGDSRLKHAANIRAVAFSPDDAWVAAGDEAGFVKIWDAATGEIVRSIKAHQHHVFSLAFSPDGKTLLTGSADWSAKLWDMDSFEERHDLSGHAEQIRAVAWNPVEDIVATAGIDRTVKLWNPADGRLIGTVEGFGQISSLAFSRNGENLAVGCYETATAFIVGVGDGTIRHTLTGHEKSIFAVAFSRDGSTLATGGDEAVVRLWDAATGKERTTNWQPYSSGISAIAFSADGKVMAIGLGDGTVVLQNAENGAQEQTLRRHESGLWTLAFSHRGRRLATAGPDQVVKICDATKDRELPSVGLKVHCIAVSPDGQRMALGWHDGAVGLWDIASGKVHDTLHGHQRPVAVLAFSPDGRLLALGGRDGDAKIRVWDVANRTKLAVIEAHSGTISGLAFSPDAQTLASASYDGLVKFWDPETGILRETFDPKIGGVSGMAFSPDWRTLALAYNPPGRNGAVKILDRTEEQKPRSLDGMWGSVRSVAFGADDKVVTAGFPGHGVKFWSLPKRTERGLLEGTGLFALNVDASQLALETTTGILLCDPVLGTASAEVAVGRPESQAAQFLYTPEGRHLAVVASDGTVHILRLPAVGD